MSAPIPIKKDSVQSVKLDLSTDEVMSLTRKILDLKDKVMVKDLHYGVIPGSRKPSLWKPGAEILCRAFRLKPEFETSAREDPNRTITWAKTDKYKNKTEGTTTGYFEYETKCTLVHIPTGEIWVRNVSGSCNNFEAKYRSLNPNDVRNTVEKMAEKRAYVGGVLIGVGGSDIFTQDLEDFPDWTNGNGKDPLPGLPPLGPELEPEPDTTPVRPATDKQVDFLKDQLKKKGISEEGFFEEWDEDFTGWADIPFTLVNDLLDWIRDQGKAGKKK